MELVFIRHGFSEWNAKNLFTGWRDVNLTERGVEEAKAAGKKLLDAGFEFDIAFTSVLTRAIKTCNIVLEESQQVHIWRRSYDTLPPLLDPKDPNSAHNDRRYAHLPDDVIPDGENLKVTLERVLPFWDDQIAPALLSGKRVLVVAHGNSLRALAKHIEGISDADIMDLEIPTGQPLVYKLDDNLKVVEKFYL